MNCILPACNIIQVRFHTDKGARHMLLRDKETI